ncbi:BlaI/MecI/CopY family transcriptional regulator [Cohnella massiliensis]|uniref:BlaI/MecI/CopY family transcriptional regulator n=1 Tax=Cohnella massiliensis TaxID=1816691 RepID=UPI0009B99B39|nr:BlaI/MecI/CopY family transcriptional regulator [Cohnella massiliensis]
MKVQRMKLNEEGLNRFFGPLEAQIMDIVWKAGHINVKEVQSSLDEELSYTAVMTVLNRLHEKGHLLKSTTGKGRNRISYYQPSQSKEEFLREQTKAVTHGLVQEYGSLVVNHFLDAFEQADPELLETLEKRLQEWKRENT